MKTYRNEKHGFEIEIPDYWSPAPIPNTSKKDLWQYGCPEEAMNFEIGPLYPEPSLDDTEKAFALFARYRGFSDVKISRIMVAGKEHVCASYFINDWMGRRWNKKYAIVLGRTEFAITATCNDPDWFAKREQDWDAIIQSFRLLVPASITVPFTSTTAGIESKQSHTLAFSISSYLLIGTLAFYYIHTRVNLKTFLNLSIENHASLLNNEFGFLRLVMFFGIGAFISFFFCLE